MQAFALFIQQLGNTAKTSEKLELLQAYFAQAEEADKVWTIALFTGKKPRRAFTAKQLQWWCAEHLDMPLWLFEECYHTVGDLAETIALLMSNNQPATQNAPLPALHKYMTALKTLTQADEATKKAYVLQQWQWMNSAELFVFNKIITGGFRIGVSQQLLIQALAKVVNAEAAAVAHAISGNWNPAETTFTQLLNTSNPITHVSKPYPFYLAYPLTDAPETLGNSQDWQAEWKWDGIRGQIIVRNKQLFIWSRGEELLTDKFPELHFLKEVLPNGTVIDGEIMTLKATPENGFQPLSFALLQTRITRKNLSRKQMQEAPVGFVAYDVLEWGGQDYRQQPLQLRRNQLSQLVVDAQHYHQGGLFISPLVNFSDWAQLAACRQLARDNGSEGLMLKRLNSMYLTGRKTGDWWKWKMDPYTIDAVMIYAQKGHGRRSNLYTDYTFAVKDGDKLVSFAKAYSGLTDKEFTEVDAFVKQNSIEKFGPVRTVKPQLVFEIAFEGIAASNRHKCGVALRFPRISRWRKDKLPDDINTVDDLKALLQIQAHY